MTANSTNLLSTLCVMTAVALTAGCEPGPGADLIENTASCTGDSSGIDMTGTWKLGGTIERTRCDDDDLNGEVISFTTSAMTLTQQADKSITLTPMSGLPAGVRFELKSDSRVTGNCVILRAEETNTSVVPATAAEWLFQGRFEGGVLTGTVELGGPRGCEGSGNFTASQQ